jgi:hypothetical protein
MEGVMNMIEAYNFYLGGYLPKVSPKTNVHNKRELKTKYKNIVTLNNTIPNAMIKLSDSTQAYALNVKEMSMELGESADDVLQGKSEDGEENLKKMSGLFNKLLQTSDQYGLENGKPSRPGGELRTLLDRNAGELIEAGFTIDEDGFLSVSEENENFGAKIPSQFVSQLKEKCEQMSMNPMEYVEQKVYSYAHLHQSDIGTAYESSMYSGMLFNSYC